MLLFSRPLQKNLSVSGTPIPVAVKDFVVNFCAKADEGQKIEEIAEKHQVESSALQQANSIRDKDKWRALANELIVIPRQERDMVDDLTRLTVDLANASQVSAVTGECKVEALGTIWGSQPRRDAEPP